MADKKSKTKSTRRKLGEAFTEAIVDSAMGGSVGEAVQRIEAAKESRKRGKGSERAPAAKRKPGTIGRPKGSRNKTEKPGRVVATGIEEVTLAEALAARDAAPAAEPESMGGPTRGRPSEYRPHFAAIAAGMARLGGSDFEIAEEMGVSTNTLGRWRSKYPELCEALNQGKDAFDDRAERSLALRAIGYSVHTEKLFCCEGSVVRADMIEHFPPDVGALKMWLGNRRPDKWKDKQEVKIDSDGAFIALWSAISDGTIVKLLPAS